MSNDVQCPYCNSWQEINHDDGVGYEEDEIHSQDCRDCDKTFAFRTEISLDYESYEAPCMNGDPHDYSPTITAPKWATKMRCSHCEKERPLTEDEKTKHSIPPIPEEYLS